MLLSSVHVAKKLFLCLSIGWWTETGRFWSCESIWHSRQMLLCWGKQILTCSLNVFIFSSIICDPGRQVLPTMAYMKEVLHKRGTCTWTLFRPFNCRYAAISRKVVGKSVRDHPERYFGWFSVHSSSSRKFERVAWEALDVRLRVLKKSSKSRFDSYSVRNSVLIISHITFRDCRMHIFSDNLSRNSCMQR